MMKELIISASNCAIYVLKMSDNSITGYDFNINTLYNRSIGSLSADIQIGSGRRLQGDILYLTLEFCGISDLL